MGTALIQLKVMPTSPDTNLEELKEKISKKITALEGEVTKFEEQPVAFGLKAIITFIRIDEDKDTSLIEESLKDFEEVSSADIVDYRRAVE
jgi:translation elongation factor aEF-1 beta